MLRKIDIDDEITEFDGVGLDDLTVARLMALCESVGAPPRLVIAAIVRDVLEDDARNHAEPPGVVRAGTNNDLH
jgi:hypothetical protein